VEANPDRIAVPLTAPPAVVSVADNSNEMEGLSTVTAEPDPGTKWPITIGDPPRAETGMYPHTVVPVTTGSAGLIHLVPLQNCITVEEVTASFVMQTSAVPSVIPCTWTSK
jgi:hypothetical protein